MGLLGALYLTDIPPFSSPHPYLDLPYGKVILKSFFLEGGAQPNQDARRCHCVKRPARSGPRRIPRSRRVIRGLLLPGRRLLHDHVLHLYLYSSVQYLLLYCTPII
jgi:hypothetical protein